MFELVKWYLDVVTDEGAALAACAARLRWGGIRVGYASVLRSVESRADREKSAVGRFTPPRVDGDVLTWRHRSLDVKGCWRRVSAPVQCTLLRNADGAIDWACLMPSARVSVRCGDRVFDGVGYAERLTVTIPPWRLPFRTLHWGRYASDRHALVWIDWNGADARRHVWFDGVEQRDASLSGAIVSRVAEGIDLRLCEPRDLCHRRALGRVLDRVPHLAQGLPGPFTRIVEHKQVARSAIVLDGQAADRGWTLFEAVSW